MWRSEVAEKLYEIRELANKAAVIVPNRIGVVTEQYTAHEQVAVKALCSRIQKLAEEIGKDPSVLGPLDETGTLWFGGVEARK